MHILFRETAICTIYGTWEEVREGALCCWVFFDVLLAAGCHKFTEYAVFSIISGVSVRIFTGFHLSSVIAASESEFLIEIYLMQL